MREPARSQAKSNASNVTSVRGDRHQTFCLRTNAFFVFTRRLNGKQNSPRLTCLKRHRIHDSYFVGWVRRSKGEREPIRRARVGANLCICGNARSRNDSGRIGSAKSTSRSSERVRISAKGDKGGRGDCLKAAKGLKSGESGDQ